MQIKSLWLGQLPFQDSLKKQADLKQQLLNKPDGAGFFMGFEPQNPVITKGLRAGSEDILWTDRELKNQGIDVVSLKRGGQATLHAPGQLVIYPVIRLKTFSLRVKDYIVAIENITKEMLSKMNVPTERRETDTGLSTEQGKLAFFGVHISQGVSQHGLALNVNNSLHLFSAIKSCGLKERPHDSLASIGLKISPKELFWAWTISAEKQFSQVSVNKAF